MLVCVIYSFLKFLFVQDGAAALHYAALGGFEEIVKILIEHGSNVNLRDLVLIFFFSFCLFFSFLFCFSHFLFCC